MEQGNLAGLITSVALSAALLNPLPFLAGLVAEAALYRDRAGFQMVSGTADRA